MERTRILELALETLEKQKADIDAELKAIRAELSGRESAVRGSRPALPAGTRRRRGRTPAERKSQSQRMKEYWAKKRAQTAKPAAKPSGVSETGTQKNVRSAAMKEAWKRRKAEAAKKARAKAK